MISSYISDSQDDWNEHIPLLTMAYRSSIYVSSGVSPAMMMFSRELTLRVDMTLGGFEMIGCVLQIMPIS